MTLSAQPELVPATSPGGSPPPVTRREIFGWCCFDFANSAFTTIIITVVYGRYFTQVVAGGHAQATGWWNMAIACSQGIVLVLSPLLGAVADATGRKKVFLLGTAVCCSLATAALYFAGAGDIWLALALVGVANIAFSLGENFCAGFLPEISTPENSGRISSYGWSFGYCGGLLSLVLALAIIESGPGRTAWTVVMTAAFFLLASVPTLLLLRERTPPRPRPTGSSVFTAALAQLTQLRRELPRHRTLAVFFGAMTLFTAGLMAVISNASSYAGAVIGMSDADVIKLLVLLQLAGIAGAFGFGRLQDRFGPKLPLILSLLLWIAACLWASVCRSASGFYGVGLVAGLAVGSLQSASRAVVSTLTPSGRAGEFFGYWGFFVKLAGLIGLLVFGLISTLAGMRTAIAVNAGFFIAGLIVLLRVSLAAPYDLRTAPNRPGSNGWRRTGLGEIKIT